MLSLNLCLWFSRLFIAFSVTCQLPAISEDRQRSATAYPSIIYHLLQSYSNTGGVFIQHFAEDPINHRPEVMRHE